MDEQLRERIADIIVERENESPLDRADAILQIPEIKEALEARRINAMSPSQFGAMLLDQLPDAPAKDA